MNSILYVYAMTCDSGFAPSVKDGLLSLACCKGGKKGGMRMAIHKDFEENKDGGKEVWVLGLCGAGLAGGDEKKKYSPIYLAKVTDVISMMDYYGLDSEKYEGRADHKAYRIEDGVLKSAGNVEDNPHNDNEDTIQKDIGGKYVVLSDNFIYWGAQCGKITRQDLIDGLGEKAGGILCASGNKKGIDAHYRGYIVCRDFSGIEELLACCKGGPKEAVPMNKEFHCSEDENDETEEVVSCCCS